MSNRDCNNNKKNGLRVQQIATQWSPWKVPTAIDESQQPAICVALEHGDCKTIEGVADIQRMMTANSEMRKHSSEFIPLITDVKY
jgi:hypothetical protein